MDGGTLRVHGAYSNPRFAVHGPALATREARPNQKFSALGTTPRRAVLGCTRHVQLYSGLVYEECTWPLGRHARTKSCPYLGWGCQHSAYPNAENFWFGRATRVARAGPCTANRGSLYAPCTRSVPPPRAVPTRAPRGRQGLAVHCAYSKFTVSVRVMYMLLSAPQLASPRGPSPSPDAHRTARGPLLGKPRRQEGVHEVVNGRRLTNGTSPFGCTFSMAIDYIKH